MHFQLVRPWGGGQPLKPQGLTYRPVDPTLLSGYLRYLVLHIGDARVELKGRE